MSGAGDGLPSVGSNRTQTQPHKESVACMQQGEEFLGTLGLELKTQLAVLMFCVCTGVTASGVHSHVSVYRLLFTMANELGPRAPIQLLRKLRLRKSELRWLGSGSAAMTVNGSVQKRRALQVFPIGRGSSRSNIFTHF